MAEHPDYLYVTNPYNINAKVHIAAKGKGKTLCGLTYRGWSKMSMLTSEICNRCEKAIKAEGFDVDIQGIKKK